MKVTSLIIVAAVLAGCAGSSSAPHFDESAATAGAAVDLTPSPLAVTPAPTIMPPYIYYPAAYQSYLATSAVVPAPVSPTAGIEAAVAAAANADPEDAPILVDDMPAFALDAK